MIAGSSFHPGTFQISFLKNSDFKFSFRIEKGLFLPILFTAGSLTSLFILRAYKSLF